MKTEIVLKFFGDARGSQARVAKALGISTAAVSKWGDEVPAGSAYLLCRLYPELDRLDRAEWGSGAARDELIADSFPASVTFDASGLCVPSGAGQL